MYKALIVLVFGFISVCRGFSLTPEEILTNADQTRSVNTNCEMTIYMEDYRKGVLSDKVLFQGYIK